MSKKEGGIILSLDDLIILSNISKKKEPISKTEVHNFAKENLKKYPERTNDCLKRLKRCKFINETSGKKKSSKNIYFNFSKNSFNF